MRVLCPITAVFWQRTPQHNTLSGIPLDIFTNILEHVFEGDILPQLQDHHCDTSAPCVVLRGAMQICISLLSVCKVWKECVSGILKRTQYSSLRAPIPTHGYSSGYYDLGKMASNISLDGRYRGYKIIEDETGKSVLHGYDYGGPEGCHAKVDVIIKVSHSYQLHKNEVIAYGYLGNSNVNAHDVPRLHFEGRYPRIATTCHGLVFEKLGLDLERLRLKCHNRRLSPRMTLAVAIQMVRMYERLHANGWLHCAAKPGNFAIGPDSAGKNTRIFMFDFEYSRRIPVTPSTRDVCDGWNPHFQPVTWHMKLVPSCRDDLEGLGYLFSYLAIGSHPWAHARSRSEMWRLKICTPTKKLFEGMDPVYVQYFNDIKALAWGEVPDYNGLVKRFVDVWESNGYGGTPGELDWWAELGLRHKDS